VTDLEALDPHRLGDGPQRLSLSPQGRHLTDGRLLGLVRRELAVLAATIAERDDSPEIAAPRFLVSLDLCNPFADAVALGFGEGGRDG
jgi:hypothetical protein